MGKFRSESEKLMVAPAAMPFNIKNRDRAG